MTRTAGRSLVLFAAAVALAGCADPRGPGATEALDAPELLKAAVEGTLQASSAIRILVEDEAGDRLATVTGFDDPDSGRRFLRTVIEPAATGDAAVESLELVTPAGSASMLGRKAVVAPAGSQPPSDALADVEELLVNFTRDGEIRSVEKGRGGTWRLALARTNATGEVELSADPPRVLTLVATVTESTEFAIVSDTRWTATWDYAAPHEEVPAALDRAVGLAHRREAASAVAPGDRRETWTFAVSLAIPVGDVEAHVKEASRDGARAEDMRTLWTMPLARGAWTEDGVTLVFRDVDGDGAISEGDTLDVTTPEDDAPVVFLFDTKTQTFVTAPGAALGALVALGAAAAWRRRGLTCP